MFHKSAKGALNLKEKNDSTDFKEPPEIRSNVYICNSDFVKDELKYLFYLRMSFV